MKFLIVTPRPSSGGAIVLNLLCKMLMDRGYDAKVFYISEGMVKIYSFWEMLYHQISFFRHDMAKIAKVKFFPHAKFLQKGRYRGYNYVPIKGCKRAYFPNVDNDTIVVYSEGIWGNMLSAKKIVRWFLYFNRYPHDEKAYEKDALYFSFREIFNDEKQNPTCRKLRLRHFDDELYRQTNFSERTGNCYIVRKGEGRPDLPKRFDGPIIDDFSEHDIVKIFNEKKYCYCYDTQTFYATIAAVCGCIPIVVPEPGKTRADYTMGDDAIYGVAYGDTEDEIEYALATRDQLRKKLDNFKKENAAAVDYFIAECQQYFYGNQT